MVKTIFNYCELGNSTQATYIDSYKILENPYDEIEVKFASGEIALLDKSFLEEIKIAYDKKLIIDLSIIVSCRRWKHN